MRPLTSRDLAFDAVIVGARGAGAALATRLASAGWHVALLDHDNSPVDAPAAHVLFPAALAELDRLGVLDRLRAEHSLRPANFVLRRFGEERSRSLSTIAGFDRCLGVRRPLLDEVLVETARQCSARVLTGAQVVDVMCNAPDQPVEGVVLADGRILRARWVIGADGARSKVANLLQREVQQECDAHAAVFSYWRGLSDTDWCSWDFEGEAVGGTALLSMPLEDDIHLLAVMGPHSLAHGDVSVVERTYHDLLRTFPATLEPSALAGAELAAEIVAVPDLRTAVRRRSAIGPDWILLGDAGLPTCSGGADGLSQTIRQTEYVADALLTDGNLSRFTEWRDSVVADTDVFPLETDLMARADGTSIRGPLGSNSGAPGAVRVDQRDLSHQATQLHEARARLGGGVAEFGASLAVSTSHNLTDTADC